MVSNSIHDGVMAAVLGGVKHPHATPCSSSGPPNKRLPGKPVASCCMQGLNGACIVEEKLTEGICRVSPGHLKKKKIMENCRHLSGPRIC